MKKAASWFEGTMRQLTLALMAVAASLVPAGASSLAAEAGARVPLVGTPVSVVLPDGFSLSADRPGLWAKGGVATIRAEWIDESSWPLIKAKFGDPRIASQNAKGILGTAFSSETFRLHGREFIIIEGKGGVFDHIWLVMSGPEPTAQLAFIQADVEGVETVIDSSLVRKVIEKAIFAEPIIEGAKIRWGGLTVTGSGPFLVPTVIKTSIVFGTETAGIGSIQLSFPAPRDLALIDYASQSVYGETGFELDEQRPVTIAGVEGVRVTGTYLGESYALHSAVIYASMVDGQPVVISGTWPSNEAGSDVITATDAIARSVRKSTPAELAGGQEDNK